MSLARLACVAEPDVADQVDELAEALLVEAGAGVVLRQHALERRVVALDGGHRVVDELCRSSAAGRCAFRCDQRASFGTQKMLTARYSSGSSGSAPCACSALRARRACSSKASEMYLRKIRPRTTCLYSAASMLLRSASAVCQSLASKPRLAPVSGLESAFPLFAIDGVAPSSAARSRTTAYSKTPSNFSAEQYAFYPAKAPSLSGWKQ